MGYMKLGNATAMARLASKHSKKYPPSLDPTPAMAAIPLPLSGMIFGANIPLTLPVSWPVLTLWLWCCLRCCFVFVCIWGGGAAGVVAVVVVVRVVVGRVVASVVLLVVVAAFGGGWNSRKYLIIKRFMGESFKSGQ